MGFKDIFIVPSDDETEKSFLNKTAISEIISGKKGINIEQLLSLASKGHFQEGTVHEFLERSDMILCATASEPRNPELEARIRQLKTEQDNADYRAMTKCFQAPDRHVSLRDDVKSVTSQITAVINAVLTVGGSFFFAYKAVEYALPEQNIPAQVMVGIITSTVVAVADLYFLARTI